MGDPRLTPIHDLEVLQEIATTLAACEQRIHALRPITRLQPVSIDFMAADIRAACDKVRMYYRQLDEAQGKTPQQIEFEQERTRTRGWEQD